MLQIELQPVPNGFQGSQLTGGGLASRAATLGAAVAASVVGLSTIVTIGMGIAGS
jgi:hypothetical protein